jgi:plastocyanin
VRKNLLTVSLIFIISALLFIAIIFLACSSTGTASAATTASGNQASGNEITIEGDTFIPGSLTIKVGESIKWTNMDPISHTVTSNTGEFDSGTIAAGSEFSFTFSKEGTFDYSCAIHPTMKGKIIVTK